MIREFGVVHVFCPNRCVGQHCRCNQHSQSLFQFSHMIPSTNLLGNSPFHKLVVTASKKVANFSVRFNELKIHTVFWLTKNFIPVRVIFYLHQHVRDLNYSIPLTPLAPKRCLSQEMKPLLNFYIKILHIS